MSRLQEKYQNELAGEIQKKLGLKNPMEVPTWKRSLARSQWQP
jgi:hypothetical protein